MVQMSLFAGAGTERPLLRRDLWTPWLGEGQDKLGDEGGLTCVHDHV